MAEKSWRKRTLGKRALKPETLMMGYGYDPMLSEGSLKPPQFQTSTFVFRTAEDGKKFFAAIQGRRKLGPDEEPGLVYSRFNNPNLEVLEDRLALWDETEASLAFASGMAAISTCLWAYLRPGDVVLQSQPIYGGTETLIHSIMPEFGVSQVGFEVEGGVPAMRAAAKQAQSCRPGRRDLSGDARQSRPTASSTSLPHGRSPRNSRATAAAHPSSSITRCWGRFSAARSGTARISSSPRSPSTWADTRISSRAARRAPDPCSRRCGACARPSAPCAIRTPPGSSCVPLKR